MPGEPADLSLEDAERLREKRASKAAARSQNTGYRSGAGKSFNAPRDSGYSDNRVSNSDDPWAKWRK